MEIMAIKWEVNHHHLLNLQAKFTYDRVNKTFQDNHGSDHGIRKIQVEKLNNFLILGYWKYEYFCQHFYQSIFCKYVCNSNCFWKVCGEVYISEILNLVTVAFHRMQHQHWGLFLAFIFNCKFCEEFWAENN